jgi:hypothetical protein
MPDRLMSYSAGTEASDYARRVAMRHDLMKLEINLYLAVIPRAVGRGHTWSIAFLCIA